MYFILVTVNGNFIIHVVSLTDTYVDLSVTNSDTILHVKQKFQKQVGTPFVSIEYWRLYLNNSEYGPVGTKKEWRIYAKKNKIKLVFVE